MNEEKEWKTYHEDCGAVIFCTDCLADIYPTWFWWKDVPEKHRVTMEYSELDFWGGEKYRLSLKKALRSLLKPNKCRAAVINSTKRRLWIPCGRPAFKNDLCKIHLKAFEQGARPSGVPQRFHEQFRTIK